MKIYTRTGDQGETSLLSGRRVSKGEARIALYGDVDELNCHLGHMLSLMPSGTDDLVSQRVLKIQSELFNLGSLLACEREKRSNFQLKSLSPELVDELEQGIDLMNEKLAPLKNFILPGGPSVVTYTHVCRAFARKVERELVAYLKSEGDNELSSGVVLLNRLSDFLFTAARYLAHQMKAKEVIWRP